MELALDGQTEALARLAAYFLELKKWNRKINLVARTLDDRQILENHFLDSLTPLFLLEPEKLAEEKLLDVGSGGGFPGLVLKAACPILGVTLVEPRQNRYFFLKHMARALDLTGVEVYDVRLEEGHQPTAFAGRHFSLITTRAFTDIARFAALASPYLTPEGRIVMMKGPGAVGELAGIVRGDFGFHVTDAKKLSLPYSKAERWLIILRRRETGVSCETDGPAGA